MNAKRDDMTTNSETVAVVSLGCAKNLINTEQMIYLLTQAGYTISDNASSKQADIVVINTCGFIESAKAEAIETILEFAQKKANGEIKRIVVTGCLAQRYKDEILAELPEIDAVVGTGSYDCIVSAVAGVHICTDNNGGAAAISTVPTNNGGTEKNASTTTNIAAAIIIDHDSDSDSFHKNQTGQLAFFDDINAPVSETKRIVTGSPVTAYLKIAEGCDNKCSYCVIPSIRGRYRSREIESIISEAQQLVNAGYRELILIAQDITHYGQDRYGSRELPQLLERLCEIESLEWIRLHYLYPDDIDQRLIDVISKYDKILKYIDMPIQHINDTVLKKMNRRGTGARIKQLIEKLRNEMPGVVIRTSLITGLPGEGEDEFEELCEFLREAKLERVGVFAFSPEEGTPAELMPRVDTAVAIRRAELLTDIQSDIMEAFSQSRVGTITPVVVESFEDGVFYGRSYAESPDIDGTITVKGDDINLYEIINVKLTGVTDGEPYGVKAEQM